jgi:predicted amidohydrolase
MHQNSRRTFLKKSALTAGLTTLANIGLAESIESNHKPSATFNPTQKLPREVWIASFSQEKLSADTPDSMIKRVMESLKGIEPFSPDVVCLPECFYIANTKMDGKFTVEQRISKSEEVLVQFSEFSKKNNCYTICAVDTPAGHGMFYISAVVIDRQGKRIGSYHKIHPTEGEIQSGVMPGPLFQEVIQTDFGKIGVQICFDSLWDDGWEMYRKQGAEIIFFPSAFSAGQMINSLAWKHKCVVVSSTRKGTTKICDITGEELAKTGFWNPQLCWAPVNLEKAFLHLWPFVQHFPAIQKKYGRKVDIKVFHEEEWAIIESLSPDVLIKDILKEFNLKTHEEVTAEGEKAQLEARRKYKS